MTEPVHQPWESGQAGPGAGAPTGSVEVRPGDGLTTVVLAGEIDSELTAELVRAVELTLAHEHPVALDASGVTFMDSAGIGFVSRLCARSAHPVRVVEVSEPVEFLLGLTGLVEVLEWPESGGTSR